VAAAGALHALLSAGLRFFDYALAEGRAVVGRRLRARLACAIRIAALPTLTRARQMVRQYPWLYRRKGLLGWEERH
jgi:hypothetical protein